MQKLVSCVVVIIWSLSNGPIACSQYYFYNEDYYESAMTWETGLACGAMNCLTDLGGKKGAGGKFIKDINWSATQPCGSLFMGANYKDIAGARLGACFRTG